MIGSLNEIYTVQGSESQTPDILKALSLAKKKAIETREAIIIYLNGNPFKKVDRKGVLTSA